MKIEEKLKQENRLLRQAAKNLSDVIIECDVFFQDFPIQNFVKNDLFYAGLYLPKGFDKPRIYIEKICHCL